jgi:hypothetical protein
MGVWRAHRSDLLTSCRLQDELMERLGRLDSGRRRRGVLSWTRPLGRQTRDCAHRDVRLTKSLIAGRRPGLRANDRVVLQLYREVKATLDLLMGADAGIDFYMDAKSEAESERRAIHAEMRAEYDQHYEEMYERDYDGGG